jgi:hypothetical protein
VIHSQQHTFSAFTLLLDLQMPVLQDDSSRKVGIRLVLRAGILEQLLHKYDLQVALAAILAIIASLNRQRCSSMNAMLGLLLSIPWASACR